MTPNSKHKDAQKTQKSEKVIFKRKGRNILTDNEQINGQTRITC